MQSSYARFAHVFWDAYFWSALYVAGRHYTCSLTVMNERRHDVWVNPQMVYMIPPLEKNNWNAAVQYHALNSVPSVFV